MRIRIWDPDSFWPWNRDGKIWIRYKHPRSPTLDSKYCTENQRENRLLPTQMLCFSFVRKSTGSGRISGPGPASLIYLSNRSISNLASCSDRCLYFGPPVLLGINLSFSVRFSLWKASIPVVVRIRIHLIRIRIQHFWLNTDPDPGFWWPKIGEKLQ